MQFTPAANKPFGLSFPQDQEKLRAQRANNKKCLESEFLHTTGCYEGMGFCWRCQKNEYPIHWVAPLPSNSHHQDYYIFRRGFPIKPINLYLPLLLGGGTTQPIHTTGLKTTDSILPKSWGNFFENFQVNI